MGWFDFLFGKRHKPEDSDAAAMERLHQILSQGRSTTDHLGPAAIAGHAAKAAIKERRFDDAWRLYHEQKQHYMLHANSSGFTGRQALELDASVHSNLANIRRLEQKHDDALVHLLYAANSTSRPTKDLPKKVNAYFNRCKFKYTLAADVLSFIELNRQKPNFRLVQTTVVSWRNREQLPNNSFKPKPLRGSA